MQKTYCDCCERELEGENAGRSHVIFKSQVHGKAVSVNISTGLGMNPVFGASDLCRNCLFDAIQAQDMRITLRDTVTGLIEEGEGVA